MKNTIASVVIPLLLTVSLVGCTGETGASGQTGEESPHSSSSQNLTGIQYSNLADAASREEVAAVLKGYGIAQEQMDTLYKWADAFNERIQEPADLPQGFVNMEGDLVDYSRVTLTYLEGEEDSWTTQINCRLSAFLLMRDYIETNGTGDEQDTYLMFDVEGIDTKESFQMSQEDRGDFITLYGSVPVAGTTMLEEHIQNIQESWRDRGIQLSSPSGLSLISVYLHSSFDEVRFVGHTGILAETDDGLLFVEKYGPRAPFQATKFQNRAELKAYLLARPDLYGDETELPPLVFENAAVME